MSLLDWLSANASIIPHLVAAVALLAVGAWLLSLHRQSMATRLLAAVLLSYGAAVAMQAVETSAPAGSAWRAASVVAVIHTTVAVALLSVVFPSPLLKWAASPWTLLLPGLAAALAVGTMVLHRLFSPGSSPVGWALAAEAVAGSIAAAVFSFRLLREKAETTQRSLFLLVVATLALSTHYRSRGFARGLVLDGEFGVGPANGPLFLAHATGLLLAALAAWNLLRASAGDDAPRARRARIALVFFPLSLLSGTLAATWPAAPWGDAGSVWRLLLPLLVAWGILRARFLGVDAQVRFAISKGTLAAVFITVFFVASEVTQEFFGDTLGSTYIGIAAAGTLVFAMVPLHRAAERLAEKAVPSLSPPVQAIPRQTSAREAAYRNAVRLALRDRVITRSEERKLLELAEHLSIPARRALEIHDEVVRKARPPSRSRSHAVASRDPQPKPASREDSLS